MTVELYRTCNVCNKTKPLNVFPFTQERLMASGIVKRFYAHKCNACKALYYKARNVANRDRFNLRAKLKRRERKMWSVEYKGGVCRHCAISFHPAAFDFHHTDPSKKDLDPGLMFTYSQKRLVEELDKCILLCANCHRIYHYEEIRDDGSSIT